MGPMGADQRRFLRQAVSVEFSGRDGQGTGSLIFESEDVSQGGAFLRCELLLEEGELLSLQFRLPGREEAFRVQARVAWVRRFPGPDEVAGMGVAFGRLPPVDQAALAHFLARR
jgi:hypothetical protein